MIDHEVLTLIAMIVIVVAATGIGIFAFAHLCMFMLLPWFIMIHIFSLGTIPMPDWEWDLGLFKRFRRKTK